MPLNPAHWKAFAALALPVVMLSSFAPPGEDGLCDSPYVGGHTGAPGETGCGGCHAGTANSGSAVITLNIGDGGMYVPGTTYTGTVRMKRVGREKFGFSCLALQNTGNVNLGGFGLLETVRTRTYTDGPRNYVSHTPCGADAQDSTEWSFTWQAPATDVGAITIYMGNLVANHSESTSGDESYTRTVTLLPSAVGIGELTTGWSLLSVFPNPSTGLFRLNNATTLAMDGIIDVHDALGRLVRSLPLSRAVHSGIDLGDLENGSYLLTLRGQPGKAQRVALER